MNNTISSAHLYHQSNCPPLIPSPPSLISPDDGARFNEGQSIYLSWSATGNEYYGEVWGGPAGTLTFGWQAGTSRDIGSQWAGYTYFWHVKARNGEGAGGWSDTRSFTVRPAAPSGLSAQATSCSRVSLSWVDRSGNEEGYRIYRNGSYIGQAGMNATTYQDDSVSAGAAYVYVVRAYRGSIESDDSNTASTTTPTCGALLPDLKPNPVDGHVDPVVPASVKGTHQASTLYAGRNTYLDWHFINSGNATASGLFHVELWIGNVRRVRYPFTDFQAGSGSGFYDWNEGVTTPGWWLIRMVVDPDNAIAESDETNNTWQRWYYWHPVTGWWGEYYNNETLSGDPVLVRDDPVIDFDWQANSPGPGVNADHFSVRWTRNVAMLGGSYDFYLFRDDGVRLFIDGHLVFDRWQYGRAAHWVTIPLQTGSHELRFEQYEIDGWAGASLSWARQGGEFKVFLPMVFRGSGMVTLTDTSTSTTIQPTVTPGPPPVVTR